MNTQNLKTCPSFLHVEDKANLYNTLQAQPNLLGVCWQSAKTKEDLANEVFLNQALNAGCAIRVTISFGRDGIHYKVANGMDIKSTGSKDKYIDIMSKVFALYIPTEHVKGFVTWLTNKIADDLALFKNGQEERKGFRSSSLILEPQPINKVDWHHDGSDEYISVHNLIGDATLYKGVNPNSKQQIYQLPTSGICMHRAGRKFDANKHAIHSKPFNTNSVRAIIISIQRKKQFLTLL